MIVPEIKEYFSRLMAGEIEPPEIYQNPVRTKSGVERLIAWRTSLIRGQTEEVVGSISSGEDVTERRESEKVLNEISERYRALVENSQDLIWECDEEGCYTYLNPAWERSHGYAVEEMLGRPFRNFSDPALADREEEEFARHLAGGSVVGHETIHLAKDGSPVNLLFNAFPVRDSEGRIVGVRGTAYDISKRRRAEAAARASEERFRATFERAAVGMVHETLEGRLTRVNKRFCEITGYSADELLRMSCQEITHPEELKATVDRLEAMMEGESDSFSLEKREVHKNGNSVWVSSTVTLVRNSLGEPGYLLGVVKDIGERVIAQERLRDSEARFRQLYEFAPIPYQSIEPDGCILDVNRTWLEMLGYTRDEVIGKWFGDFLTEDSRSTFSERLAYCFDCGEVRGLDFGLVRKDGVIRLMRCHGWVETDPSENSFRTQWVLSDITERKRAEREVLESRERLLALTQRLHEVREEERISLARELHDEVAQGLTALRMDLGILGSTLSEEAAPESPWFSP